MFIFYKYIFVLNIITKYNREVIMKTCSYMKLDGTMCGKNCYYDLCRTHKHNAILKKCLNCERYTQSKSGKCHCRRTGTNVALNKERDELLVGYYLFKVLK